MKDMASRSPPVIGHVVWTHVLLGVLSTVAANGPKLSGEAESEGGREIGARA